ncbi:F-box only protein 15 [Pholidichthys leucotaenia]
MEKLVALEDSTPEPTWSRSPAAAPEESPAWVCCHLSGVFFGAGHARLTLILKMPDSPPRSSAFPIFPWFDAGVSCRVLCSSQLPPEILMKILSYLDASALYSISHINKLFYQLANDNGLWHRIYMAEFGKQKNRQKSKSVEELLPSMAMEKRDGAAGYWKWLYFKAVAACDMNKCKRLLRQTNRDTGLPSKTEEVLRNLHVTWELTVTNKSGHESTLEQSWAKFCGTSVTLYWTAGGHLSDYRQISTLHLHGVRSISLKCPSLKKPGWRSLMEKVDIESLATSTQTIGQDRVVQLLLLRPGIVIGLWKEQLSVAFVMFTLHIHSLVERSIRGTSVCPYQEPVVKAPFNDIDPDYGLHGYQLHIVLHNTGSELMSARFPSLFCHRTCISNGLIHLVAIKRGSLSQHIPLLGDIILPWQSDSLEGKLENCFIMSLTLLDEFSKPFKCVSTPIAMRLIKKPVSYSYDGDHYQIHYHDSDIQVKMTLVWMEEQQHFVLISLVVYVTVLRINEYFGRDY